MTTIDDRINAYLVDHPVCERCDQPSCRVRMVIDDSRADRVRTRLAAFCASHAEAEDAAWGIR